MSEPTLSELIRRARVCVRCGRAHEYRLVGTWPTVTVDDAGTVTRQEQWSWADPDDGHAYRMSSAEMTTLAWLESQRGVS